jgi:subtilisin family serine protease
MTEKFLSKLEILQRVLGNTSKQPIKVAILDTGIDLPDNMPTRMRKPRYRAYSWIGVPPDNDQYQHPPKDDQSDPDGHGTHMASIILDIARNCQLYVVQIAGARSEACGEETNDAIAMNIARAS